MKTTILLLGIIIQFGMVIILLKLTKMVNLLFLMVIKEIVVILFFLMENLPENISSLMNRKNIQVMLVSF